MESLCISNLRHLELRVRGHVDSGTLGLFMSIRKQLRQQRAALPKQVQQSASQRVTHTLKQFIQSRFKSSSTIAIYAAFEGEIDVMPLYEELNNQYQFLFPIVKPNTQLAWAEITNDTQWALNKWGIREPINATSKKLCEADLVLMPLVAFDLTGNRIGMGKGFYDRALGAIEKEQQPYKIGCAYSFQQLEHIHSNTWDVPMDTVTTELGWAIEPSLQYPAVK